VHSYCSKAEDVNLKILNMRFSIEEILVRTILMLAVNL
jgi:hypothetical protein